MDKILIVDDERNIHYSFQRVLGHDYEVLSAFSGDEALRQKFLHLLVVLLSFLYAGLIKRQELLQTRFVFPGRIDVFITKP